MASRKLADRAWDFELANLARTRLGTFRGLWPVQERQHGEDHERLWRHVVQALGTRLIRFGIWLMIEMERFMCWLERLIGVA